MNILKLAGWCALVCVAGACNNGKAPIAKITTAGQPVCIDTAASCSHLTKDSRGNIVLSYVKTLNDTQSVVCYAVSGDQGQTFGDTHQIPGSENVYPHGENMPKIIFMPGGEIIAAWGAANPNPENAYSGVVYYTQSFDNGNTWNGLNRLTKDTASYDQRYFDMALLPDGEAGIIWLDNRKKTKKEGSTLYFASTAGKSGFMNESPIGATCCQCCRTNLFADNKNIHAVYRAIIDDSIRDMAHSVSTDGGKTFSAPQRISADNWVIRGCPHTGPSMTENKNGLHFAWHTGSGLFYCHSQDNGKTFSRKDNVSGKPSAKHPQITALPGGELLIAWDETIQKGNSFNAWIGIQLRTPEGKELTTAYLTPDSTVATFPAILPIDSHKAIVAYTQQIKNKTGVFYQIINVTF